MTDDFTCPKCGGRGMVTRTDRPRDGQRQRRMVCRECGHRWKMVAGMESLRQSPPRRSKISDAMVVEALTSHGVSNVEMGRRLRLSHQAIRCIRLGESHRNVRPDLPRWNDRTCEQCIHWRESGSCDLEFPDPAVEGPVFAAWCSSFHAEEAAA